MNNDQLIAYGMALVTLSNRINDQDLIIEQLQRDIAWMYAFITGIANMGMIVQKES